MLDEKPVEAEWRQHIVSTPEVLSGKPRINGTRISVALISGFLASGATVEEITDEYPGITHEHIAACLNYARELAEYRVV
jgi:uncharacterized protein (DUF433 family)